MSKIGKKLINLKEGVTALIQGHDVKIEGPKVFLSMKNLIPDPWKSVKDRYTLGQKVKGKVLKVNPFGLFVELDPEIHGLAHVSEVLGKQGGDISTIANPGDEMEFVIVSIEPEEHRLGLSVRALHKPTGESAEQPEEKSEASVAPEDTTVALKEAA